MLMAIDIGNTNILVGIFCGDELRTTFRLASDKYRTADQYCLELEALAGFYQTSLKEINGVIISSVVPAVTPLIRKAIELQTGKIPLLVEPGIKSGLKIKIDDPTQLGADLVSTAVGAVNKYSLPCLIVDLGTAIKISVIDSNGCFRGCSIAPGIGISLKALADSASLLPYINLSVDNCATFGTNTISSMQSGMIIGTASMIDGMCERIEKSLGESIANVIATGGYAQSIIKHCNREIINDPNLILYGLKHIYNKNQ